MSREDKSLCPLCKATIASDSAKCGFCGALFLGGTFPFILRGIECPSCGHKNYSYDYCIECKKPFTVVCPMCNERIGLSLLSCPNCGLKRERFNVVRELGPEGYKRKRRAYWGALAAAIIIVAGLVVTLTVFWRESGRKVILEEKFKNPRYIDSNGDKKAERVEYFDDKRRLIKIEEDLNSDGVVDKVTWVNPQTQKPIRIEIISSPAGYRVIELYDDKGALRMKMTVSIAEPELIKVREDFSSSGALVERWEDKNGDGAFDIYQKFRPDGSVWIDAQDSKGSGFIDAWRFYNSKEKLVSEAYDLNGDGIFEKTSTYGTSGKLIKEEFDLNSDGFIEEIKYYSSLGKMRGKELDTDGDGLPDYFEVYTKRGIFVRKGFDIDGDGSPDKWE